MRALPVRLVQDEHLDALDIDCLSATSAEKKFFKSARRSDDNVGASFKETNYIILVGGLLAGN